MAGLPGRPGRTPTVAGNTRPGGSRRPRCASWDPERNGYGWASDRRPADPPRRPVLPTGKSPLREGGGQGLRILFGVGDPWSRDGPRPDRGRIGFSPRMARISRIRPTGRGQASCLTPIRSGPAGVRQDCLTYFRPEPYPCQGGRRFGFCGRRSTVRPPPGKSWPAGPGWGLIRDGSSEGTEEKTGHGHRVPGRRDAAGQPALRRRDVTGLSDGQLLDRFLADRDASAFEALVTRHGPMVLSVCRGDPPRPGRRRGRLSGDVPHPGQEGPDDPGRPGAGRLAVPGRASGGDPGERRRRPATRPRAGGRTDDCRVRDVRPGGPGRPAAGPARRDRPAAGEIQAGRSCSATSRASPRPRPPAS